ncbi:MAG: transglycosylase SLT domain-containing protein [Gammaproteobacteria bacterium]|nr:transglycosylase SLT domain-containing protein [Gammaproteobacteria bacterium]MBU1732293.1 transglycosylase SLT domain-containing protein [Gammaproteobacteria bacterium]MBU1893863.1 transglycosylase SLT domain-containing protein [Gammaproteobacteria bacterium]
MRWVSAVCLLSSVLFVAGMFLVTKPVGADTAQTVPRAALKYQRDLTREARAVWGLNANVPVMAAQIHQESRWNETAESKYAQGLAQFTPATAKWISGAYRLGAAEPFNPSWALRALVTYDKHLWDRTSGVDDCNRWAFTLAGYNGGAGWIIKERKMAREAGDDPDLWFGGVERYNARATWAWRENRDYPRKILIKHQPTYKHWGVPECSTLK